MNTMQIADLRIENFRGIRTGRIRFGPHTVFIGPNNCGKTTVIEALALLFGRDRMIRALTERDFFGSDPQPADRIRLVATIIGFDGDEPADRTDWFRDDRSVISGGIRRLARCQPRVTIRYHRRREYQFGTRRRPTR
jgi:putative ATP-dependent endonuclease of OLD family